MNQTNAASLISEDYRRIQQALHESPDYGVASVMFAPLVADTVRKYKVHELLDYGAGKGRLGEELEWLVSWPIAINHYDPAVPEWSATPAPSAFVTCLDVLEHIEPSLLPNVLDDLKRVTADMGMFTVHTGPAIKVLADGRNAHLIQRPPQWWLPQIMERFELLKFSAMANGFWVLVRKQQA